MRILAFHRRDPWWGLEGPAAKRRRRYHRFMSFVAFVASLVALAGAGAIWAIHLGLAARLGIQVALAIS